ncbi:MAG: tocopherol cyclase family protein [Eubacteriales bacterium]|nr:tocopherol cyclase family protein [Eubacteriales bacterium]
MKNPAHFQGERKRHTYFEGWYFKCISADRKQAIALIPGMAIDPTGQRHAFIQVIDAVAGRTWYFELPFSEFTASQDRLEIRIGANSFHSAGLSLDIDSTEGMLSGHLKFSEIRDFPVTWHTPSIMGPFQFVPFMECYHAIVHLSHRISGTINLNGTIYNFDDGAGYIEKDYGRSFPQTYLWIQASHFDLGDASFVFSRARIPWLGSEFQGFFAYLTNFQGIETRFATYNFSRLNYWQVDPEKGTCQGVLDGPIGRLEFTAQMRGGGKLRAPIDGLMNREIIESITATVSVKLTNLTGDVLFDGTSGEAGMEICL